MGMRVDRLRSGVDLHGAVGAVTGPPGPCYRLRDRALANSPVSPRAGVYAHQKGCSADAEVGWGYAPLWGETDVGLEPHPNHAA